MHVEVSGAERLRFGDGSPVRAASAVVRFGDGRLVVSDDATHAAWFRPGGEPIRLRLLPPVDGEEVFDEESGTKLLKPDLEAACEVAVDGEAPLRCSYGLGLVAAADDVVPGSARGRHAGRRRQRDGRGVRRSCRPRWTSISTRSTWRAPASSGAACDGSIAGCPRRVFRAGASTSTSTRCGPPHSARSRQRPAGRRADDTMTSGPRTASVWRSPTSSRCRAATCSRAPRRRTAPTPATTGR